VNDKSIILSELNQFELDLSQFNSNDLLVNIQVKHVLPFEKETEELKPEASKLINAAHQKEREEGVFPLCLSEGILFFKQPACEQQIPIFLHLLNPKINPVLNQVSWNITADEWIINPYLLHVLSFEETEFTSLEKKELCDLLSSKGYDVEPSLRYIGNFHPYRHSLLKEVIELKKESDLSHFDFLYQGAQRVEDPPHKSLAPLLFETDHTQYQAIKRAEVQHVVIQGPPGTGKSQVIGNLIGRFLEEKKQVLLCSQKRQALEVIASKLTDCGLGELMLMRNSQDGVKTSIQSLAKSWEAIEKPLDSVEQDVSSTIRLNWLQGQLDLYHKEGLIGKMSPKDFITATRIEEKKKVVFHAGMPRYSEWLTYKPIISTIPESVLQKLGMLNRNSNLEHTFETRLKTLKNVQTELSHLQWQHLSYGEILEQAHMAQTVHLFSNDTAQRCLPWMKHRSKINRLIKKLELIDIQLQQKEHALTSWKKLPSIVLLSGLRKELSKSGLFKKIHLNRLKRNWLTDTTTDIAVLIELTEVYHTLLDDRLNAQMELISLGLTDIRTDITAYKTFNALFDGNLYEQYHALSKQERSFYCTNHSIADELARIKANRKSTQERIVHQILVERKNNFDAFHRLIATPSGKLTASEKALKNQLIIGKRILSRLFSRKRNFPSLRDVLESEAAHWISLLKPIWLSSPVQIAMDLPLIKNRFDVAIIDEASQLLLSHSLGTIYRSKQLIVAGDSMQMAPSAFFQRGNSNALTLLDQAAFNLPQSPLKFHYRSQHEELIQFSNQHFYNNELIVLPSYPNYQAIASIYLPGTHYKDGTNLVEAQAAKNLLIEKLGLKDTRIGLVAFSEKQLKAIVSLCTAAERLAIEVALESDALFLKTAEQIQGDECDEIIISFGYGYNEDGRFDLRFGPLTQEGGDKRLNVLFSRAKRKIHFIHSVRAEDFPMSENPTIHVLKQWFSYVESTKIASDSLRILHVMDHQMDGREIRIQRWIDLSPNVFDLITYESILSARGWVIREEAFSSAPDHTRVLPLDDSVKFA